MNIAKKTFSFPKDVDHKHPVAPIFIAYSQPHTVNDSCRFVLLPFPMSVPSFFGAHTSPRSFLRGPFISSEDDQTIRNVVANGGSIGDRSYEVNFNRSIHFVWLGDDGEKSRFHQLGFGENVRRWTDMNPGFEVILWDEMKVLEVFGDGGLTNHNLYEAGCMEDMGRKSDVLRYEILYRFGGFYFDVDYIPTKPLIHLVELCEREGVECFFGASNSGSVEINNGAIGCVVNSALMGSIIDRIGTWWSLRGVQGEKKKALEISPPALGLFADYLSATEVAATNIAFDTTKSAVESCGDNGEGDSGRGMTSDWVRETITETGPGVVTKTILGWGGGGVKVFPFDYFHCVPNNYEGGLEGIEPFYTENTVAVHMWKCSWQK